jgi:hypothetical protein
MYLERTDFCRKGDEITNSSMHSCRSPPEHTEVLLWLNQTCSGSPNFAGMPASWQQYVANYSVSPDKTVLSPPNIMTAINGFPSCADYSCQQEVTGLASSTAEDRCILDPSGRYCNQVVSVVLLPDFCGKIAYQSTCASNCTSWFDRKDWVMYLNQTCGATTGGLWSGLPANWTELVVIPKADLRPWPNVVNIRLTADDPLASCPTAEASLGVFAAVNLAMLLLTPLLGRRTIVARLTLGRLGKPHSQGWMLMGPLTVVLQTIANGINVALIRLTPGYEGVDVTSLMMLWFSRPRLAWLSIVLVIVQVDEAMYLSCAASALCAEVLLQLLSAYAMGMTANHARTHQFLLHPTDVRSAPRGIDAMAMYAGAILWLVIVFFTLAAIALSILELREQITRIGRFIGVDTWRRKRLRKRVDRLLTRIGHLSELSSKTSASLTQQEPRIEGDHIWRGLNYVQRAIVGQVEYVRALETSLSDLFTIIDGPERDYYTALSKMVSNKDIRTATATTAADDIDAIAQNIRDVARAQLDGVLAQVAWEARQGETYAREEAAGCKSEALLTHDRQVIDSLRKLAALLDISALRWHDIHRLLQSVSREWNTRTQIMTAAERRTAEGRKLKGIVVKTLLGMLACWLAQWLFWVGFVRLYVPDA